MEGSVNNVAVIVPLALVAVLVGFGVITMLTGRPAEPPSAQPSPSQLDHHVSIALSRAFVALVASTRPDLHADEVAEILGISPENFRRIRARRIFLTLDQWARLLDRWNAHASTSHSLAISLPDGKVTIQPELAWQSEDPEEVP